MTNEIEESESVEAFQLLPSTLFLAHRKGVRNQILIVSAILCYCITSNVPIGFSVVLLPQLFAENNIDVPNKIPIDMEMGTWIASIPVLGTPCGSFLGGILSDAIGRRNTLIFSVFPIAISWCIMALANSYTILLVGRFLSGFAVTFVGGPVQVYIAEVTEPKLRGILTCAPFAFFSAGILLTYVLGALFHWRIVAWIGIVLVIASLIPLYCVPESPSWLLRNKKTEKALKGLKMLRGHETIAEEELKTMQKRLTEENATSDVKENIFQLCSQRAVYKPLTIVTVFNCLQILTGNFILINYANDFIKEIGAKVDTNSALIATAVTRELSAIIFCSIVSLWSVRKLIMALGTCSGITSFLISIFLYIHANKEMNTMEGYIVCACLMIYILFNTPMLMVPGVIIGEFLPARVRGRCGGYVFCMMNICLFGIIKWYPYMQNVFKLRGVFLFFTLANIACTILVYLFHPDTTGLTLNEIEDYFKLDNWLWIRRDKTQNPKLEAI